MVINCSLVSYQIKNILEVHVRMFLFREFVCIKKQYPLWVLMVTEVIYESNKLTAIANVIVCHSS